MKVYSQEKDGILKLSFVGELDHHDAKTTMKTVDGLIDEYLPHDCILNLSELTFMDSSGIAVILRVNKRMKDMSGRAWVEDPAGQPLRVLDTSGIDKVIKIIDKAK